METLLDKLRRHELALASAMVDVLLTSGDALKAQLARHQGSGGAEIDTTELLFNIRALVEGESLPAPAAAAQAAAPVVEKHDSRRELELTVGPLDNPKQADNLLDLFKEITDLGTIEALDAGQPADGMRRFRVSTTSSDSDLLDLFTFHV